MVTAGAGAIASKAVAGLAAAAIVTAGAVAADHAAVVPAPTRSPPRGRNARQRAPTGIVRQRAQPQPGAGHRHAALLAKRRAAAAGGRRRRGLDRQAGRGLRARRPRGHGRSPVGPTRGRRRSAS
jgi:hypothetical protein